MAGITAGPVYIISENCRTVVAERIGEKYPSRFPAPDGTRSAEAHAVKKRAGLSGPVERAAEPARRIASYPRVGVVPWHAGKYVAGQGTYVSAHSSPVGPLMMIYG